MGERQIFLEQLLSFGFTETQSLMALDKTGVQGVQQALDWILSNPDPVPPSSSPAPTADQVPSPSQNPSTTPDPPPQGQTQVGNITSQQTPSIRCGVCGIAIFGEAHATKHATQTKHVQFEEYIPKPGEEPVAPPPDRPSMTEEEKLAKIEEMRKINEVRREQKKIQEEKEQFEREKKRRKDAKEMEAQKQKWKEEQENKIIEEQKREKVAAAKQLEEVRRRIEEDKLRREQVAKGVQSVVVPPTPQPVAQTVAKQTVDYDKCDITIRLTNGSRLEGTFQPTDTIQTLFEFTQKNRTDGNRPFNFMITYPKKVFTSAQNSVTLLEADLVPRAMLIVTPK